MINLVSSRTLALFKPYDVLCQFTDAAGRSTLKDYVTEPGVYPVGRLDRDSEGLVLLSNDGNSRPSTDRPELRAPQRPIWSRSRGCPLPSALEALREGIVLSDGRTRPAEVELLEEPPTLPDRPVPIRFRKNVPTAWLRLTLREGRNRQVRRMTAATGHPTLRLLRIAIGPIELGNLAPGQCRELTAEERVALETRASGARTAPIDLGDRFAGRGDLAATSKLGYTMGKDPARRLELMTSNARSQTGEPALRLSFDAGTLIVEGPGEGDDPGLPGVQYDARTKVFRAEAIWYRTLVEHLRQHKIPYTDNARGYEPVSWKLQVTKEAFPHQLEGLEAWWKEKGRGVVVLPTGTGKTHLANLAIERAGRPTLVITPTIDLMNQWYDELVMSFGVEVGLLGGGYYDVQPLTVTTYDSAYLNMERLGNRFGLIVFDECHHLPGPTYGLSATMRHRPVSPGTDGDSRAR